MMRCATPLPCLLSISLCRFPSLSFSVAEGLSLSLSLSLSFHHSLSCTPTRHPHPPLAPALAFSLRDSCALSAIWYGERGFRASNAIACKMSQSRPSVFLVWLPCMITKSDITHLGSACLYHNPKPETPRWELHV